MKAKDFEKQVLKRGLKPLEVVTDIHGNVKWFITKGKDKMVLFDADGYAYTASAEPEAEDFIFSGEVPKCHGRPMTFDPHDNLIF